MDEQQQPFTTPPTYDQQPPPYTQQPPYAQQPPYPQAAAGAGLSDTAAGAIAYITIIPAIIFLVMEPYNQRPFVKFHAFQNLGIAVAGFCLGIIGIIPILGWIVFIVGMIALFIAWVLCVINAAQGKLFKLPLIGNFAAQQAGVS